MAWGEEAENDDDDNKNYDEDDNDDNDDDDEIQNINLSLSESGACDLMEEHFRKSLGADYSKLFKEKPEKVKREASEPKESLDNMDVDDAKAFKDDIDMSGYTGEHTDNFVILASNIPMAPVDSALTLTLTN